MSTSSAVEFAVLGAGAIGSILSAHLACAGRSLALLARGQRAQQIQRDGLRITGLAEISTPVPVLTDPSQLREAQVLIVATKASGTAAALQGLRHIKVATAFSIQNGLLKNELLAETFGQERVLGALAPATWRFLSDADCALVLLRLVRDVATLAKAQGLELPDDRSLCRCRRPSKLRKTWR